MLVWGRNNSNNVKKVLWALEETGAPYERLDAGGAFGVVDTPEFGVLNPNRRVPVLENDGIVLWESNSIVRYLGALGPSALLNPADPGRRALADRWMDWTSINFAPPFTTVFWTLVRTLPEKRDLAALEAAQASASRLLEIVEGQLGSQPYLSGDEFGVGDIPLGTLIHVWFNLPIERPDHPSLLAWYQRLLERSAYRKVVALPLS